jgi:hypothetical protein
MHVPINLKFGILNLLEPPGPVQARNGIALPLYTFSDEGVTLGLTLFPYKTGFISR